MPCYQPLEGYRKIGGGITWTPAEAYIDQTMTVSCGQCIGCRLERSRQWAVRIMHEASQHDSNCFLTLTYADEYLPENGSLDKRAFPLFMKRLRKRHDERLRYFHCGEYGEKSRRPHYHACLFGTDFSEDRYHWADRGGNRGYRSGLLEQCWPYGHAEIGDLTFESAAYVARYVTKKITGSRAKEHYVVYCLETGEEFPIEPEYATMSRRPGIGRDWIERYSSDVYPSDQVVSRGHPMKPPRYYDLYYQEQDPETATQVFEARQRKRDRENESPDRLQVREACAEARLGLFSPRTGVDS